MKAIIEKAKQNKSLIGIYHDSVNTNDFAVGYIIQFDKDFAAVVSIDKFGYYDGIFAIRISTIIKIEQGTKYLNKVSKLVMLNNTEKHYIAQLDFNNTDIAKTLIKYLKTNRLMCSIELCDSNSDDVVGQIKKYTEKSQEILVDMFDEYAEKNGQSVVLFGDISKVSFETKEDIVLSKLLNSERNTY